jgi:hypothetical protein
MQWKPGTPLAAHQTGHAVLRHAMLTELGYPPLDVQLKPDWFFHLWGDDKRTPRLRTFGHSNTADLTRAHFLATRSGTPMHTDPAYHRYALQLQLYNEGFVVHGLEDEISDMPLFVPGLVVLLDTWSPHRVSRDPRMPNTGPNKLLVGSDFADIPDLHVELPLILEHLRHGVHT